MERSVPALTLAQLRSVASAIAAAAGSATAILDEAGTVLAANAAFDALVGSGAGESRRSIFELGGVTFCKSRCGACHFVSANIF